MTLADTCTIVTHHVDETGVAIGLVVGMGVMLVAVIVLALANVGGEEET